MVGRRLVSLLLAMVLLALLAVPGAAVAASRQVVMSTSFPDVTVGVEQSVTFSIKIINLGDNEETLGLEIAEVPPDWKAGLWDQTYGTPMGVRSLRLLPGKEEAQIIYLRAVPPAGVKADTYKFVLKARSADGVVDVSLPLSVKLVATTAPVASGEEIKLSTFYPIQRGPSGVTFVLRVDMVNSGSEDRTLTIATTPLPEGWQVLFRPAYEEKLISSLTVPAGNITRSVDVEVTPPKTVEAGEYPFQVIVAGGNIRKTIDLAVEIFGTYDLTLALPTERLNAEATAGRESHLTLRVFNTGSADLRNVNLVSNKPDNWVLTFNPDSLAALPAGQVREVDVTLKPPDRTIAGDYGITLMATSLQAQHTLDIRVAVGTSTIWGWVGLGIVALVIIGMAGVFIVVGRR